MTLPTSIALRHISHVADDWSHINRAIDDLNDLVWNALNGENSWYSLEDDSIEYEFFVSYSIFDKALKITRINGRFYDRKYVLNFVGMSGGYLELVLPERKYVFAKDRTYGSFSSKFSSGLVTGSGYFQELAVYDNAWAEANRDTSRNTKWIMSAEKETEAATFILDLCKIIRQRNEISFGDE